MAEEEKKRLYGGSYDDEIRDTYQQIMSQPKFSYDLDGDALYQQYKDRYTQNAKLAMKDTMGQAAALTGGYGNSYAQGVGQQRYDETMRGLTDMIPQLEERAYQRWKGQGDALRDRYSMLNSMAATEKAGAQEAYSRLYALIGSTGYMPTAEELAAAGMTQEAADALRNEYLRQTGQLPAAGGSGSGGGSGGGSSGGGTGAYNTGSKANGGSGQNGKGQGAPNSLADAIKAMREKGASQQDITAFLVAEGGMPTQRPVFPYVTGWMK